MLPSLPCSCPRDWKQLTIGVHTSIGSALVDPVLSDDGNELKQANYGDFCLLSPGKVQIIRMMAWVQCT